MLLDRIESPVPDSTETPARTLKAIVLPAPHVPPIVLFEAPLLTITPLTSSPSGALPVMSGPIRLPRPGYSTAPAPSSRTPQWLAEIRFRAAAVVPPMVFPGDRGWPRPRKHSGSHSVRLVRSRSGCLGTRLPVDVDTDDDDTLVVTGDHLGSRWHRPGLASVASSIRTLPGRYPGRTRR